MNKLQRATHRSNLALLFSGLACLIISVTVFLTIWNYPYAGPDLRSGFCLFLAPGFAMGVFLTIWGFCELRASKSNADPEVAEKNTGH